MNSASASTSKEKSEKNSSRVSANGEPGSPVYRQCDACTDSSWVRASGFWFAGDRLYGCTTASTTMAGPPETGSPETLNVVLPYHPAAEHVVDGVRRGRDVPAPGAVYQLQ